MEHIFSVIIVGADSHIDGVAFFKFAQILLKQHRRFSGCNIVGIFQRVIYINL